MISLGSLLNVWGPGMEGPRELYSGWWKHRCLLTLCELWEFFSLQSSLSSPWAWTSSLQRCKGIPMQISGALLLSNCFLSRTLTHRFQQLQPTQTLTSISPTHQSCWAVWVHLPVPEVCTLSLGRFGVIGGKGDSYVSLLSVLFVPCLKTVIFIYFVQFASCCSQWEVKYGPCNSFMAGCGSAINFAGSICMIIYY